MTTGNPVEIIADYVPNVDTDLLGL